MKCQKRPPHGPTARWQRFLLAAVLSTAMAGCSTLAPWSAKQQTTLLNPPAAGSQQRPKRPKRPLFGPWFRPKEPEPPQSLREFMDLDPVRW